MAWMSLRPGFTDNFEIMAVVDVSAVSPCFPEKGTCLYMRRRGARDVFQESPPPKRTWGAHATSPYCIRRIIAKDTLAVGMASLSIDKKDVFTVYFHLLDRMDLCQATYGHYVSFRSLGWFYAPTVLIVSDFEIFNEHNQPMKTIAKRSGVDQRLTYPGNHEIVGLLWHMVHVGDTLTSPACNVFNCEAACCRRLELSPNDSWEVIQAKSEAWKDDPMWVVQAD